MGMGALMLLFVQRQSFGYTSLEKNSKRNVIRKRTMRKGRIAIMKVVVVFGLFTKDLVEVG